MPQNSIPGMPEISQQIAAAGNSPVQVHQGAPAGIPAHPGVVAQQVQQQPKQKAALDFFAQVASGEDVEGGGDTSGFEAEVPQAQAPIIPQAPSTDLISVDDLLSGGQFSEPPVVQQPQAPQQQVPQAQQPQVQAPQPVPQSPQQPQAQAPTPEALQMQAIDYLRGGLYRFTDVQARQALTEPETLLPELAARLHVNVVTEMGQHIQRVIPVLVEREVQRRTAVMEAKNEFFQMYPKLNRPEWQGVIADSIGMAAQMHQGKTRGEIMREGAALAVYRLRSQAPRAPAPGAPRPFTPASPGSGGPSVPMNPQQPSDIWSQLAADPDLMNF